MQAPQQLRRSMRKGSRLTFGHLSYVASYKHPTARKSAAGAAISWRVRPSVIGVEYALIVVCRVTASVCLHPAANLPRNGRMRLATAGSAQKAIRARTDALGEICSER
jgi:hypothetical protein